MVAIVDGLERALAAAPYLSDQALVVEPRRARRQRRPQRRGSHSVHARTMTARATKRDIFSDAPVGARTALPAPVGDRPCHDDTRAARIVAQIEAQLATIVEGQPRHQPGGLERVLHLVVAAQQPQTAVPATRA